MNSEIIGYYLNIFDELKKDNKICGFIGFSNVNLSPAKPIPFSLDYYKDHLDKDIDELDIENHFIVLKNNLIFSLFEACVECKEENNLEDVRKVLLKQIDSEQKLWEINALIEAKEKLLDGIVYMLSLDNIATLEQVGSVKVGAFLENYQSHQVRFAVKDNNFYVFSLSKLNFDKIVIKKDHKVDLKNAISILYPVNMVQNFNNYYQKAQLSLKDNEIDKAIEYFKLSIEDKIHEKECFLALAKIEFDRGRYIDCLKYSEIVDDEYFRIMTRLKTNTEVDEIVENYDNIRGKYKEVDIIISDIFLSNALVELEKQQIDSAVELIKKSVYANKNNAKSYFELANIKFSQGALEDAFSLITQALSIVPDNVEYLDLKARLSFDLEDYDSSIETYNDILALNSSNPQTYLGLGLCYFIKEDYDNALENYIKLTKFEPKNKEAYIRIIAIHKYLKQYDKALVELEKILETYPKDFEFLCDRAKIYESKKMFDRALSDYKNIISVNPGFIYAYYKKAEIEAGKKIFKDTKKDIARVIELYENQPDIDIVKCYKILVEVELQDKNYGQAVEYLDKIFAQEDWKLGYTHYAFALKQQRNFEKAIEYYKKYLNESNEDNENVFLNLSEIYFELKEYNLASDYISRAIMINAGNYMYYFQRGNIRKALLRHSEAILDYDKAIALNPAFPQVYVARGTTKKEIGKIKEAFDDFKKASSIKEAQEGNYNDEE